MKVLVLGSGGREHALAWRLSRDPQVSSTFILPGNPGMKHTPELTILDRSEVTFEETLRTVKELGIALVVIGPEKFLFEGWVDEFQRNGIPAFGPNQASSFLESSKIKSKLFMREFGMPTADFAVVHQLSEAIDAIEQHPEWKGYALKLSGPAQGKGVIVCHSTKEAKDAATQFFKHQPSGIEDGMVIEECIHGREVSLFYVCMNDQYQFLASACDHKRLLDHDLGPNTGGMGAYSPATWFHQNLLAQVEKQFVIPTLKGMQEKELPFQGMLFLGLMVRGDQLFLLEYNTRFGDPETQTFLPLLEGNFANLLLASATKNKALFGESKLQTKNQNAIHVVKTAKGYPGLFGQPIESKQAVHLSAGMYYHDDSTTLFFAGVSEENGCLITSGGRVLGITSVAATKAEARKLVYEKLDQVHFNHEHFRSDIGSGS